MGLLDKLLKGDSNISFDGGDPTTVSQIPLDRTFNRTSLDMEDPLPSGGPITTGLPIRQLSDKNKYFFLVKLLPLKILILTM
jgi:hypothetical protein